MQLGQFRIQVVSGGRFKMDGGTMFGVVPRTLWAAYAPPDAQNLIRQATNCLFVDTGRNKVLIDTGYGSKMTDRQRSVCAAEEGSPLTENLQRLGISPDTIDTVILSHLHFDHAGGAVQRDPSGDLQPTFPNAQYIAQRYEWMLANADLPELRGAYARDDFVPLQTADCLRLVDGNCEIVPGVRSYVTGGHTPAHQCVLIESDGETAVYLGDVCPTSAHLPIRWGMAYDLDVVQLRRKKADLLAAIADRGWLAFFDHDPQITHSYLVRDPKRDFELAQ